MLINVNNRKENFRIIDIYDLGFRRT